VGWDLANIENQLAFRKTRKGQATKDHARQNGLTTTRMTIPIIKMVGTSLKRGKISGCGNFDRRRNP
jgi:hypothetical protein